MFSIGEFSRITGLTVKTLRFYHELGVLIPACVDERTGYRYYHTRQIDRARIIAGLRGLDFTLEQIGKVLANCEDEADILDYLERQKKQLEQRMRQYRSIVKSLETLIHHEKEARMTVQNSTFEVEEKTLDTLLIAAVRMKGRFGESGQGFAKIGKALGRYISGKCFLLHHDTEYREDDAEFEACMPIRKAKEVPGISIRELPGGRCVSLLHLGPYEEMGRSYAQILEYVKVKNYEIVLPTREVYVKGPGMIFRGNPKKYVTEIQLVVRERKG